MSSDGFYGQIKIGKNKVFFLNLNCLCFFHNKKLKNFKKLFFCLESRIYPNERRLVLAAPPQFKIQYRNQTARRGEDAVLECEAEGETPIGILWSKDNINIDPNQEVR